MTSSKEGSIQSRTPRGKNGFVVWLTGLPGSGKTTIARTLRPKIEELGHNVEVLDGDEVRKWLSPSEGFSREDRERHLRRVAHVCNLLARNGVVVLSSFISPYRSTRDYARKLIGNFFEVYVSCSLQTCMKRDPKGLYRMGASGIVTNVTGIQDPYEQPTNPELVVNTEEETAEGIANRILEKIEQLGYLG